MQFSASNKAQNQLGALLARREYMSCDTAALDHVSPQQPTNSEFSNTLTKLYPGYSLHDHQLFALTPHPSVLTTHSADTTGL